MSMWYMDDVDRYSAYATKTFVVRAITSSISADATDEPKNTGGPNRFQSTLQYWRRNVIVAPGAGR